MPSYPPTTFFTSGPFAKSIDSAEEFATNIVLSHYFEEAAMQQQVIEEEYFEAILDGDEELAKQKKQQLNMCVEAIQLTATLFDYESIVS
jgi:peroxiredoxin family protein